MESFLEVLRRLFSSRKFVTALAAWLVALAGLVSGTITTEAFVQATVVLALAVIGGIALEDAAEKRNESVIELPDDASLECEIEVAGE